MGQGLVACLSKKNKPSNVFAFQASDHPFDLNAQQLNERIKGRIVGELVYLSGESLISSTTLNKSVHQS